MGRSPGAWLQSLRECRLLRHTGGLRHQHSRKHCHFRPPEWIQTSKYLNPYLRLQTWTQHLVKLRNQILRRKHTLTLALPSGPREKRRRTERANTARSLMVTLTLGGFGSDPNPLPPWDPLSRNE